MQNFGGCVSGDIGMQDKTDVDDYDEYYSLFRSGDGEHDFFAEGDDVCKRFQFGGQFGVNFGYKAFNFGFAYYLDTPYYKYNERGFDYKVKNHGLSLTVGYNF